MNGKCHEYHITGAVKSFADQGIIELIEARE